MSRKDWEKTYGYLGPPGTSEDECLKFPVLGDKDTNRERVARNAFVNGVALIKDAKNISEYSQVILLSLAGELLLKAIVCKTTGNLPRGHDLHELFFSLNQDEQNTILDYYLERSIPLEIEGNTLDEKITQEIDQFENCLALNAMCFETLRYKHELSLYVYNVDFLFYFCTDLERLGVKLGFDVR